MLLLVLPVLRYLHLYDIVHEFEYLHDNTRSQSSVMLSGREARMRLNHVCLRHLNDDKLRFFYRRVAKNTVLQVPRKACLSVDVHNFFGRILDSILS